MFAQVVSVEAEADKLPWLLKFCQDQLSGFSAAGFKGLYLLADRENSKVMTISLWDSEDDLRRNHEVQGARVREEARSGLGIGPAHPDVYEVVLQA
jgi:heme-degrading monooxygenase HmoA